MTNLQVLEKLRARLLSNLAKVSSMVDDPERTKTLDYISGMDTGLEISIRRLDELVKEIEE